MTNARQYIEALEFEREGYVRRGLEDRVAQVDEQIEIWEKKAAGERRAADAPEDAPADAPEDAPADAPEDAEPDAEKVNTNDRRPRSRR